MKLEVGMFIRTPLGIDKIIKLNSENSIGYSFITQKDCILFLHKEINEFSIDGECFDKDEIKASHKIIDLIEEGDYVNGEKVVYINHKYEYLEVSDEEYIIKKEDIKSIVTKEQFSSMEYKINE